MSLYRAYQKKGRRGVHSNVEEERACGQSRYRQRLSAAQRQANRELN